jgi:hypothetical protein
MLLEPVEASISATQSTSELRNGCQNSVLDTYLFAAP